MTALALRGLTWRVGGVAIVDNVDLDLAPGEFLAVIGPNGAGKTSLFNLVTGMRRAGAGTVVLDGRDVARLAPHRRARLGLGRPFQSPAVFGSLTVRENVRLAVQAALGGSMRLYRSARRERSVAQAAAAVLDRVRLTGRDSTAAGALSHGEKRKLEIALLLAALPRVMLLDEPMAGMSAEEVPALVDVVRGLTGTTRACSWSSTTWTWCSTWPTGSRSCTTARCSSATCRAP